MSKNKEWLAHKGLSTAGKAAELKARVKEWVDNDHMLAPLPAVCQILVPTVPDVAVVAHVDSRIDVVGETTQVYAQAAMDDKVVEESTV